MSMIGTPTTVKTLGELRAVTRHLPDETAVELEDGIDGGTVDVFIIAPRHGERIVVIGETRDGDGR